MQLWCFEPSPPSCAVQIRSVPRIIKFTEIVRLLLELFKPHADTGECLIDPELSIAESLKSALEHEVVERFTIPR